MGFLVKRNNDDKLHGPSGNHGVTIITAGCHFNGKLFCRGVSRIGGSIDGEIVAEGILIIEEDAVINANIKAVEVVIQGKVKGTLEVESRIELINTGSFCGDLVTPNLHVEDGALLNGTTKMIAKKHDVENIKNHKKKKKAKVKELGAANRSADQLKEIPMIDPNLAVNDGKQSKTPEVGI